MLKGFSGQPGPFLHHLHTFPPALPLHPLNPYVQGAQLVISEWRMHIIEVCVCVGVRRHMLTHSVVLDSLRLPQTPLSMGFSRREYWSRFPFPSPGDLPDPGIEPTSLASPALAGGLCTTSTTWEAQFLRNTVRFLLTFL